MFFQYQFITESWASAIEEEMTLTQVVNEEFEVLVI